MQTRLAEQYSNTPLGKQADKVLRSCVHCGFCNATCPTYQLLGDELDGPRGRIYLIKQVLEGNAISSKTQTHLDRCLTCRSCETTCPSGVDYHNLLDIGRAVVDAAPRLLASPDGWLLHDCGAEGQVAAVPRSQFHQAVLRIQAVIMQL